MELFGQSQHRLAVHSLSDLKQAEIYVRHNDELIVAAQSWSGVTDYHRVGWKGQVEAGHAQLLAAHGRVREAEAAYKRAEAFDRQSVDLAAKEGIDFYPEIKEEAIDSLIAAQARMKSRQGRVAEGEAYARRALLGRLKAKGKYNIDTAQYIGYLANILVEQGRLAEGERLIRSELDIYRTLALGKDLGRVAQALNELRGDGRRPARSTSSSRR
jgi:hypothetical protein